MDLSTSNNYRRLGGRNGNGFSRNVIFFGILVALVVVFSTFYLYISASNDVANLKYELRNQADYSTKLKNELLEINVRLEELKSLEAGCKESKITMNRQLEECATNLKQANEDAQSAKKEKTQIDGDLKTLKSKNSELSAAKLKKHNMTAMETVGVGQEAIVIKLNETVDALRRDLILKDELIRKLENANGKPVTPASSNLGALVDGQHEVKEEAPPVLPAKPATTTKSSSHIEDLNLPLPDKAQPGDRVKIEEENQKKENDGTLLKAAEQQDVDTVGLEAPLSNAKSTET
ncbi:hypothetical protein M3Y98_00516300 [Aphelenchoides besseyi]|nr:hypothetical protein M3Y98_00516300 [Aphelenchoides besseyi]